MKRSLIILISLILLFAQRLYSDEVKLTVQAPAAVSAGQQFRLVYNINTQGARFSGPKFGSFEVLTGPFQSYQESTQIINGQVNSSKSTSYTYVLAATKEGTFSIPAASASVRGKTYTSKVVNIKVVKGKVKPQTNTNTQSEPTSVSGDDVFLRTIVSKTTPYQGEQVTATVKLYFKVGVRDLSMKEGVKFPGFWSVDLTKGNNDYVKYKEVIKGVEYTVVELQKYGLYAQKSGRLQISAIDAELTAIVMSKKKVRDPFFDQFFNRSSYSSVRKKIKSNPVTINVKALPETNKSARFNGAVGKYNMEAEFDKTELKTNEAANLKITIKGKGNLSLIDELDINFPPDFEVYDPKIISTGSDISGSKTFEYLVIPRKAGEFTINPVEFSYFDLNSKRYVDISSDKFVLKVAKGDGSEDVMVQSGVSQEEINYIGSDIRFIKNSIFTLRKSGDYFFGSGLFFILLVLPLILFVIVLIVSRKQLKARSDVMLMKHKKATKVALKRLKTANALLKSNDKEGFFIEISRALWGYISDKFSIPLSELSIDSVNEALIAKNVKPELIKEFISTLNNCEYARFAPGDSSSLMQNIYNEALSVISKTERELR